MKGDGGKNQKNSSTKNQTNNSQRELGLSEYAFAMEIGEEVFVPSVSLQENPDSPRAITNSPPSSSPRNSPDYSLCSTPSNLANLNRPTKGSDR